MASRARSVLLKSLLTLATAGPAFAARAEPPGRSSSQPPPRSSSMAEARAAAAKAPPTAFEAKCRALIKARGAKNESARLRETFAAQWAYVMTAYPEWATHVGYPGQNARWTDNSFDAIARREREMRCQLDLARGFDRAKLNGGEKLDHELFLRRAELAVEEQAFMDEYLAVSQLGGVHTDVAQVLEAMPKGTEAQYRDILARLKAAPAAIDQSLALLKEGVAKKVTPPKITLRDVPAQVAAMIAEKPLESPWLLPFKDIPPSIPAARAEELRAEAARIYVESVKPKLAEFREYLTEAYIPNARATIALKDLPDGEAWYAFRVKETTTTDLTPRRIHDIGLKEVARITGEMEKVLEEAKFKGTLDEFRKHLRTDKKFFHASAEDLIRGYRDIAKRADAELPKMFGKLPRLPYGVAPVPAYSEKSQPTAYYMGGSSESGRAGYFYANTYDLKSRPRWEMEALTLHEAVPGHHLQIALAQEMDAGPDFRKHDHYTAYVEGWGLYAESLGYEMGFYKDPYQRFGQLTYEMWRALRLVVDTGIHQLGWSREQAIDFMKKHLAKAEHDIVVEVDRYIVWPGQATAYKIGQLKIRELRDKAAAALGERFDVRKFHDAVLGRGSVPLNVLESLVDGYIRAEKGAEKGAGKNQKARRR